MKIKDEIKEFEIEVKKVNIDNLIIPRIQRGLSESLVHKLIHSIEKVGFITPLIVVESKEHKGKFEIIDGQHRYEAGKILGYTKLPVFIVPHEVKNYILTLNTEKASNLKDKAHQVYEIYMYAYNNKPDLSEYDLELMIEEPYYLTVGFVIERFEERKFSGYAWENVLKKIDNFFEDPIKETDEFREKRAKLLIEVNNVLTEKFNELALGNHLLKSEIVNKTFQSIYGKRVRTIDDDFETAMEKIKEGIKEYKIENVLEQQEV